MSHRKVNELQKMSEARRGNAKRLGSGAQSPRNPFRTESISAISYTSKTDGTQDPRVSGCTACKIHSKV